MVKALKDMPQIAHMTTDKEDMTYFKQRINTYSNTITLRLPLESLKINAPELISHAKETVLFNTKDNTNTLIHTTLVVYNEERLT